LSRVRLTPSVLPICLSYVEKLERFAQAKEKYGATMLGI
jgi:hypothetical protein